LPFRFFFDGITTSFVSKQGVFHSLLFKEPASGELDPAKLNSIAVNRLNVNIQHFRHVFGFNHFHYDTSLEIFP